MKFMILAVLAVSSCDIIKPAKPPMDENAVQCAAACEHWEELGCEIAEPDEEGNSCELVCETTQSGGLIDLHPEKAEESEDCP